MATTIQEAMETKPLETPTLTHLKNNNVAIPDVTPTTIFPESAYSLSEVSASGTNTITKYVYDETSQTLTPKYYQLTLNKTTYGSGDQSLTFTLGTIPTKDVVITYKYNLNSYTTKYENQTNDLGTITDVSGTLDYPSQIEGGILNGQEIKNAFISNNSTMFNLENAKKSVGTEIYGGAIYNDKDSTLITGDFIDNSLKGTSVVDSYSASLFLDVYGGAIANNNGAIDGIIGNFIGNYVHCSADSADVYADAYGGAIANKSGSIDSIKGVFIGNYVLSLSSLETIYAYGGAISNKEGTIGDIVADFIGNYASAVSNVSSLGFNGCAHGGAIGNYAQYSSSASIGNITGNFIGNYVYYSKTFENVFPNASGGAIYNSSSASIGNITGDFIGNYAISNTSTYGGAIDNEWGTIGDITGDFIGNYASTSNGSTGGGAIDNNGTTGNITGDFINNHTSSVLYHTMSVYVYAYAQGGAIYNTGTTGDIIGDFMGNSISSTSVSIYSGSFHEANAYGGAISNTGTIANITGNFIGNYAYAYSHKDSLSIPARAYGGAIYNTGTTGDITGNFIGNYVHVDLVDNSSNWTANAYGGAVYNESEISDSSKGLTFVNSNFINNYAKSEKGVARGGAIYNSGKMNIVAKDGFTSFISGNYVEDKDGKRNEAIFVSADINEEYQYGTEKEIYVPDGDYTTYVYYDYYKQFPTTVSVLQLEALNNGKIVVNDILNGGTEYYDGLYCRYWDSMTSTSIKFYADANGNPVENPEMSYACAKLNLTGDSTGEIYLNNHVQHFDITHSEVTTNVAEGAYLNNGNSLAMTSGTMNIAHMDLTPIHFRNFDLTGGNINIARVDVDLANKQMGRFTADTYNNVGNGKINVNGFNLTSDSKENKTSILFADEPIRNNVQTAITEVPDSAQTTAFSPIYKYTVSYDKEDGFFTFVRGGGSSSGSAEAFNPAVLPSSVASQSGSFTTQVQAWDFSFQHSDTFMAMTSSDRIANKHRNQYAMTGGGFNGVYSPLVTASSNAGYWVKPYAVFENLPLRNGPKVQSISYGTLIGADSDMERIKGGFDRVFTYYIGYNGSSQYYNGVHTYQNGGLLGFTTTLYKNKFFNATTISTGANVAESQTMYGNEYFTSLTAGIANKTGYNFEFQGGKFIVQPTFMISYMCINTFDYTNAAGVRIDSDPMHAILLTPGVKFIMNTAKGWQPYLAVNMVWNPMNISKVMANDVKLPEMSIKPYVMYGLGVQKRFKDKFLAFGQAMLYNGGRNGVALTAGLRWMIGK